LCKDILVPATIQQVRSSSFTFTLGVDRYGPNAVPLVLCLIPNDGIYRAQVACDINFCIAEWERLDEEIYWRELQQLQAKVAMEREVLSQKECYTCYPAPVEQGSRIKVTRHLLFQVHLTCNTAPFAKNQCQATS